jgi:hypothetical protein
VRGMHSWRRSRAAPRSSRSPQAVRRSSSPPVGVERLGRQHDQHRGKDNRGENAKRGEDAAHQAVGGELELGIEPIEQPCVQRLPGTMGGQIAGGRSS